MSIIRINHSNEVSVEELCLEDINWWYGTGQDRTTGEGRNKEHHYRSGVMTRIGDILLPVWCELAKTLISREGLNELCAQLEVYYRETPPQCRSTPERRVREHSIKRHYSLV